MPGPAYPVGLAIKGPGGRKTKENRHIRSARSARRSFKVKSEKLIRQFERAHGVTVDPNTFLEMSKTDTRFAKLGKQLVDLRVQTLGE